MTTFVNNCPRCGANKVTFDVIGNSTISTSDDTTSYEIFVRCRHCKKSSIAEIYKHNKVLNNYGQYYANNIQFDDEYTDITDYVTFIKWIDISVTKSRDVPEDLPSDIYSAFEEGVRCLAVNCPNAASAMFRLCLDLATKSHLPKDDSGNEPNQQERRNLAPRLRWLFNNNRLPGDLKELSAAVKLNGDDGVHEGSLTEADAEDIYEFAYELLERLYSQPARLAAAQQRRALRRQTAN